MTPAPVSLELYGSLSDVLLTKGFMEVFDERPVERRVQFVRYTCGSARHARLVRIELETPQGKRTWTPEDDRETLNLCFDIPAGERVTARLIRGRNVDPLALDDPFLDASISLEVIG